MADETAEERTWRDVKERLGDERVTLGPYVSYQLRNTPRHLLFTLSYYKFAAKLIGEGQRVLEVGCSEGLGTRLLAEFAEKVTAIDLDADAIEVARTSLPPDNAEFHRADILEAGLGTFDAVASFDVAEHVHPENEAAFFDALAEHLADDGVCIVGTPNEPGQVHASEVSRAGHVNLFTAERLQAVMAERFARVFVFSANDEIVHTGYYPMAHYLIAVGVCRRRS